MSDVMLHGVLNMPLPDDPTECDLLTWVQFKDRARQASARIEELEAALAKAMEALEGVRSFVRDLEPYADQGHTLVPALKEACNVLAELKGQDDD